MSEKKNPAPGGRSCGACLAWDPWTEWPEQREGAPKTGICRAHPPRQDVSSNDAFPGAFPATYELDWCLEYRPRDAAQTVPVGEQKIVVNIPPRPKSKLEQAAEDWDGKPRC